MLEIIGTIVEGPIPKEETAQGGVKLVAYTGGIVVLHEQDMHPSFVNLKAGQQIVNRYIPEQNSQQIVLHQGE